MRLPMLVHLGAILLHNPTDELAEGDLSTALETEELSDSHLHVARLRKHGQETGLTTHMARRALSRLPSGERSISLCVCA